MCNSKTVAVLLLGIFLASTSYAAETIYVDVNGPNDPGTGTFDDPFRRIQDAIDSAIDGDIIEIRAGVYTGPGNYDLDPGARELRFEAQTPRTQTS